MKTTAYTRPSAPLCNNAATTHGGRRTRPRWRAWLAAGLLACAAGGAVAEDGEPGFSNYAQLASISVGGVAASFPVGLEDDPLHITVPAHPDRTLRPAGHHHDRLGPQRTVA
ncbi:MAG: hypothetical protein HEQ37_14495 [Acidovorax sp.]|nr:hypothetical protein [Acidovorax sp.]